MSFRWFRGRRQEEQVLARDNEDPFSPQAMFHMGFLFNYEETVPDYIRAWDSSDLLGKLSINLVEAGDKLAALKDPDGLTDRRGPEVQNMADVLCELGRFPKDAESLDRLYDFLVTTRKSQGLPQE